MDKREAVADALHAWSENCPDRDYFFGDGDTTVFSMMQDTCADGARIIREMTAELAALRSAGTDQAEAKAMREACAQWHEAEARRHDGLALNANDRILGAAAFQRCAADHRSHAAAIRALPLQTTGGGDA